jgi:sugar phosphate isomerase/epimerase
VREWSRQLGVAVLIETHDSHPTGSSVSTLFDEAVVGRECGAIWDVAHTWRAGEAPSQTVAALGDRLAYVQIKDLEDRSPEARPALPGHGVLPLDEVVAALRASGYQGVVCLEWERAWHPEIPDLATALDATVHWLARHAS